MTREFIEAVNSLLETNKPKRAFNYCKKELSKFENKELSEEEKVYVAEVHYAMSGVLASCGKMEEARQALNRAIKNNPNEDSYYYYRAEIEVEIADYTRAIKDYTKCIKLNPSSVSYGKRGSVKMMMENFSGAVIDCTKAIKLNPEYGGGYVERGRAKYCLQNYEGAIKDYTKAIELFPEYAFSYGCRAEARRKIGDVKGAIEDYKKLKQLEPRNEIAKQALRELKETKQKQVKEEVVAELQNSLKTGKKIAMVSTTERTKPRKRDIFIGKVKKLLTRV